MIIAGIYSFNGGQEIISQLYAKGFSSAIGIHQKETALEEN